MFFIFTFTLFASFIHQTKKPSMHAITFVHGHLLSGEFSHGEKCVKLHIFWPYPLPPNPGSSMFPQAPKAVELSTHEVISSICAAAKPA